MFPHRADEPGHGRWRQGRAAGPLPDLGRRVVEGSGGVMAWPMLESACRIINEMASFESAGVSDKA